MTESEKRFLRWKKDKFKDLSNKEDLRNNKESALVFVKRKYDDIWQEMIDGQREIKVDASFFEVKPVTLFYQARIAGYKVYKDFNGNVVFCGLKPAWRRFE